MKRETALYYDGTLYTAGKENMEGYQCLCGRQLDRHEQSKDDGQVQNVTGMEAPSAQQRTKMGKQGPHSQADPSSPNLSLVMWFGPFPYLFSPGLLLVIQ